MKTKHNVTLVAAAVLGFSGVALGAFGAHALKTLLPPQAQDWWSTGVEYHLVHAVALIGVALLPPAGRSRLLAAWAFGLGVLLFSGSLYLLALTGAGFWGAVAPVGGVAFLVGWAALGCQGWKGTVFSSPKE